MATDAGDADTTLEASQGVDETTHDTSESIVSQDDVEEKEYEVRKRGLASLRTGLDNLLPTVDTDDFNRHVESWEFRLWLETKLQDGGLERYQSSLQDEMGRLKSWDLNIDKVADGETMTGEASVWQQVERLEEDISSLINKIDLLDSDDPQAGLLTPAEETRRRNRASFRGAICELFEKIDSTNALSLIDVTSLAAAKESLALEEALESDDGYENYQRYIEDDIKGMSYWLLFWQENMASEGTTGEEEFIKWIPKHLIRDAKRMMLRNQLMDALQKIISSRCPPGHEFSNIDVSEFALDREERIWRQSCHAGHDIDTHVDVCRTECADLDQWLHFWDETYQGSWTGEDMFRNYYYYGSFESEDATILQPQQELDDELALRGGWPDEQSGVADETPGDALLENNVFSPVAQPPDEGDKNGVDVVDGLGGGDVFDSTGFPDPPSPDEPFLEKLMETAGITPISSGCVAAEPSSSEDQTSTFASTGANQKDEATTTASSSAAVAPFSPQEQIWPSAHTVSSWSQSPKATFAPTTSSWYHDPILTSAPAVASSSQIQTSTPTPAVPLASRVQTPAFELSNEPNNSDGMDGVQQQTPQVPTPAPQQQAPNVPISAPQQQVPCILAPAPQQQATYVSASGPSTANESLDVDMSELDSVVTVEVPDVDTTMEDEPDRDTSTAPESNGYTSLPHIVPLPSTISPFLKGENPFAGFMVPDFAAKDAAPTTYFSSVPRPQVQAPIQPVLKSDTIGDTSKWWFEKKQVTSSAQTLQPKAVVSNVFSFAKDSRALPATSNQSKGFMFNTSGLSFGEPPSGATIRLNPKPTVDFGVNTADVEVGMRKPVVPQLTSRAAPPAIRCVKKPQAKISAAPVDTTAGSVAANPPEEDGREVSVAKRTRHVDAPVKQVSKPSIAAAPSKPPPKAPSTFTFFNKAVNANSVCPTKISFDSSAFCPTDFCFSPTVVEKTPESEQTRVSVPEAKPCPPDSAPADAEVVATGTQEQATDQQIAPLDSYKDASSTDSAPAADVVIVVDAQEQVSEEPEHVVYSTSELDSMFDTWQRELDMKISSICSQVELDSLSSDEHEDENESDLASDSSEEEDESFEESVSEGEQSLEGNFVQDSVNTPGSTRDTETGASKEAPCEDAPMEPAGASFRASVEHVEEEDEAPQQPASNEQQPVIFEAIEPDSKKQEGAKIPVVVDTYLERITQLSSSILLCETIWADRHATAFFIPRALTNIAGALHTEYRGIPYELNVFTAKRLSVVLSKWHALLETVDAYINLSSDFPSKIAYELHAVAEETHRTSVAVDTYTAKAQKAFGTLRYDYWRDMAAEKRDHKNALMAAVKTSLGCMVEHYMEYFQALQELQTLVPIEEVEYLISVTLSDYQGRIKDAHKMFGVEFADIPVETDYYDHL